MSRLSPYSVKSRPQSVIAATIGVSAPTHARPVSLDLVRQADDSSPDSYTRPLRHTGHTTNRSPAHRPTSRLCRLFVLAVGHATLGALSDEAWVAASDFVQLAECPIAHLSGARAEGDNAEVPQPVTDPAELLGDQVLGLGGPIRDAGHVVVQDLGLPVGHCPGQSGPACVARTPSSLEPPSAAIRISCGQRIGSIRVIG